MVLQTNVENLPTHQEKSLPNKINAHRNNQHQENIPLKIYANENTNKTSTSCHRCLLSKTALTKMKMIPPNNNRSAATVSVYSVGMIHHHKSNAK